VFELLEGDQES